MKLSISRSGDNIWVWLLWGLCIYLALELGPFVIAKQALDKTVGELVGPYLFFAVPAVVVMPLIWWLRKWEERGAAPKRLARMWGLSTALFIVAVAIAVFYSGIKLRLIDARGLGWSFTAATLWGVFVVYFSVHRMALRRLSARSADGTESTRPK